MKKYIRKIRKISKHSYTLVLPKELMKKFKWKEKQKLEILYDGKKKEFKVRDWKPKK